MSELSDHRFVFIGGLHRSGTTIFHDLLTSHPEINGLSDTNVPMNEGQFLQDVFAPEGRYRKLWPARHLRRLGLQAIAEKGYGGPGRFAFDAGAHLTEESRLVSRSNAQRIFAAWAPYWNTRVPYLAEKSPPNLIRMRFLQALFPETYCIVVCRHPIAVSLATQRAWRKHTSLYALLRHWSHAHELFERDRVHLKRVIAIRYEDLLTRPLPVLRKVWDFLGVEPLAAPTVSQLDPSINERYFMRWREVKSTPFGRLYIRLLRQQFSPDLERYGYSFDV